MNSYAHRNPDNMVGARDAHFLPSTARKLKVRLDTMALMKPVQLKDTSAAEAIATPTYSSPHGVSL